MTNTHWRLIIKNATENDLRNYRAVAKNSTGTAQSEAQITRRVDDSEKPRIIEGLKKTRVKEDEEIKMSCRVSGKPQPDIQWLKNELPIQADGVHVEIIKDVENGIHKLIIHNAKPEDAGDISVKVTNIAGTETSKAKLAVEVEELQAPEFIQSLRDATVTEKQSTTFTVVVTGKPAPKVEWFKDGCTIHVDEQTRNEQTGTHTFTLKKIIISDSGVYSCKAINKVGVAETKANFKVEENVEAPKFTDGLKSIEIKATESATMSVTVTGKPEPTVEWFKDDWPVQIDNQHIILNKDSQGHHELIINKAICKDAGIYLAKAVNKVGKVETQAKFSVIEEMETPKFITLLYPLEVPESETTEFSVVVTGKPEPKVEWLKDGRPIQIDNEHFITKQDSQGRHSLTVKNANVGDAGIYSAKAVNQAGRDETMAKFGVIEDVEVPHFTKELNELELREGVNAKLECTVVGKPVPKVQWFRDGNPINIDNSHFVSKTEENGHHILIVNNARTSDAGTYTCKAVNKAGKAETEADLLFPKYILERTKEEEIQPFFIQKLESKTVKKGEQVELECKINKESKPEIQWFLNDKLIDLTTKQNLIVEKLDDGTIKLKILSTLKEEIGVYKCEAVNKVGKAETSATLKYAQEIEIKAESESSMIHFIQELVDQEVVEGFIANFECQLDQVSAKLPGLRLDWYKDGANISVNIDQFNAKIEQFDNGIQKLQISNAKFEHLGMIRCQATDSLNGSSIWTEARLSVTGTYFDQYALKASVYLQKN